MSMGLALLNRYLFKYRNTEHCYTRIGQTPAYLMLSRNPRTRWDCMRRNDAMKMRAERIQYYQGSREVNFEVREEYYIKNCRNENKSSWKEAAIVNKLGY